MAPHARVLFARLIDYAGLFPPARLPLEEAVAEYVGHRDGPDAHLLARFVCPIESLRELESALPAAELPTPVAALLPGSPGAQQLLDLLADAGPGIAEVARRRALAIDQLELRLPVSAADQTVPDELLEAIDALLARVLSRPVLLAAEVPLAGASPDLWPAAAQAAGRANTGPRPHGSAPICLKARCGGPDPGAFPSTRELAGALVACRDHNVPLKLTQGLHHAFPATDQATGARAQGFVNVLFAAALARAEAWPADRLTELLEDDGSGFSLAEDAFTWRGHALSAVDIAAGRRFGVISIGSCSFTEPVEELRRTGLLGEA